MSQPNQQYTTVAAMVAAGVAAGYGLYKLYNALIPADQQQQHMTILPPRSNEYTYMDPDTLSQDDYKKLLEQFTLAREFMQSKHGKGLNLSNTNKLRFYSYFKTATIGPNNTPKPSLIDFERVAMWNAWSELNGTSKIEAMISYVELLHQIDQNWREKVVSKALEMVLGENGTMVCDNTQNDSQDEDDKLFEANRMKSTDELDDERRKRMQEKKLIQNKEKQEKLRAKFSKNNGHNNVENHLEQNNIKTHLTPEKEAMGPVFSSGKNSSELTHGTSLKATTITIGDDNNNDDDDDDDGVIIVNGNIDIDNDKAEKNNNNNNNEQSFDNIDESSNNQDDKIQNESKTIHHNNNDAHSMHSGEQFIRVFRGDFSELTQLDDLNLFQNVIEDENILAVLSKHPNYSAEMIKNDQSLLFSYKVILVDINRVTLLHQVAESGTVPQCGILLHTFHYPIDLPNVSGNTPLMLALGNERFDMVKYLIEIGGADVLAKNNIDNSTVEDLLGLCDDKKLVTYLEERIRTAKGNKIGM
jgi:diazepam-binding inhibitor (GABA receptor modulating acyl-CoA-binding protein)